MWSPELVQVVLEDRQVRRQQAAWIERRSCSRNIPVETTRWMPENSPSRSKRFLAKVCITVGSVPSRISSSACYEISLSYIRMEIVEPTNHNTELYGTILNHKRKSDVIGIGYICTALRHEKLTFEALIYGSHSFYTANAPYLPSSCKLYQTAPPVITGIWLQLLLIYRPWEDERLSCPTELTYSGRFTHIISYPSAAGQVQVRESSPVRDRRSATELHH